VLRGSAPKKAAHLDVGQPAHLLRGEDAELDLRDVLGLVVVAY